MLVVISCLMLVFSGRFKEASVVRLLFQIVMSQLIRSSDSSQGEVWHSSRGRGALLQRQVNLTYMVGLVNSDSILVQAILTLSERVFECNLSFNEFATISVSLHW